MPFLVLIAIIIAVLFWTLSRQSAASKGSGTQACRWNATGNDNVSLGEYYCRTCKVTAYAQGGKPPQECKRSLRRGGL